MERLDKIRERWTSGLTPQSLRDTNAAQDIKYLLSLIDEENMCESCGEGVMLTKWNGVQCSACGRAECY